MVFLCFHLYGHFFHTWIYKWHIHIKAYLNYLCSSVFETMPHKVNEVTANKYKACFSETCFSPISYYFFLGPTHKCTGCLPRSPNRHNWRSLMWFQSMNKQGPTFLPWDKGPKTLPSFVLRECPLHLSWTSWQEVEFGFILMSPSQSEHGIRSMLAQCACSIFPQK